MKKLFSLFISIVIALSVLVVPIQTQAAQASKSLAYTNVKPATVKYVYITNTGKKYHKSTCSYLKKSKTKMKLTTAKAKRYTPCSRCNPPTK